MIRIIAGSIIAALYLILVGGVSGYFLGYKEGVYKKPVKDAIALCKKNAKTDLIYKQCAFYAFYHKYQKRVCEE